MGNIEDTETKKYLKNLGKNMRIRRIEMEYTIDKLANLLKTSHHKISAIENGEGGDLIHFIKLLKIYNIEYSLLDDIEYMVNDPYEYEKYLKKQGENN